MTGYSWKDQQRREGFERAPEFREMGRTISLHGLGFLQVKLDAKQRLHVWHPDLPRRTCFEHSAVHDHRFGFTSTVLRGVQQNVVWGGAELVRGGGRLSGCAIRSSEPPEGATHAAYRHEGDRTRFGNRPWNLDGYVSVWPIDNHLVQPGETYHMRPYVFHSTYPCGDGRVATLMTKTFEGHTGSRSLVEVGHSPDVDFDRFQMSEDDMWTIVREVLSMSPTRMKTATGPSFVEGGL